MDFEKEINRLKDLVTGIVGSTPDNDEFRHLEARVNALTDQTEKQGREIYKDIAFEVFRERDELQKKVVQLEAENAVLKKQIALYAAATRRIKQIHGIVTD